MSKPELDLEDGITNAAEKVEPRVRNLSELLDLEIQKYERSEELRKLSELLDLEAVTTRVDEKEAEKLVAKIVEDLAMEKIVAKKKLKEMEKAEAAMKKPSLKKVVEEDLTRQWAFVRKVYGLVAIQCLLATASVSLIWFVPAIPGFFSSGPRAASQVVFIAMLFVPIIVLCPMARYRNKYPVNLLLMCLLTLCCSLNIGIFTTAYIAFVPAVMQFFILVAAGVSSLILLTIWEAKRHRDISLTLLIMVSALVTMVAYLIIQIGCPLGRSYITFSGHLASLLFCYFIIFDTKPLMKRHSYNEHADAAISLYEDLISLPVSRTPSCCA